MFFFFPTRTPRIFTSTSVRQNVYGPMPFNHAPRLKIQLCNRVRQRASFSSRNRLIGFFVFERFPFHGFVFQELHRGDPFELLRFRPCPIHGTSSVWYVGISSLTPSTQQPNLGGSPSARQNVYGPMNALLSRSTSENTTMQRASAKGTIFVSKPFDWFLRL